MPVCEVCRGRKTIRLPLYRPASVVPFDATPRAIASDDTYRDYPCPECAPTVQADKVQVIECYVEADTRYEGAEGYRRHIVGNAARQIAEEIERAGLMRIQSVPLRGRDDINTYRMTVGVVPPKVVAEKDKQQLAASIAFAQEVINLAAKEINNWGSYYEQTYIDKARAAIFMGEALREITSLQPR